MKTIVVLAVSIVLVSIFFCPMVMAAPPMPNDVQIVQPDPSLPKELLACFGKWEGSISGFDLFLIVEKLDEEKATVYQHMELRSSQRPDTKGWHRYDAKVEKERGKYIIWYTSGGWGMIQLTLKDKYLNWSSRGERVRLSQVP